MPGERRGFTPLVIPDAGEIRARMRVTFVREPQPGNRNRPVACEFTDISRGDGTSSLEYMMRRQLEMRRRGQL